jgi:O-antigen/teichoic acid export membrane protein
MVLVTRGAFSLVAATAVLGTIATLVVIELASDGLSHPTRLVLGGLLGVLLYGSNVTAVGAAVARGRGRVLMMELSILVPALGKLAALALLTALDLADIRWVAAGYAIGAAAGIAAAWASTATVLGPCRSFAPDLAAARDVFRGALPFAVVGLSVIVISRLDVVVLGLTGTGADVGAYEPTLKLVEQAMLVVPLIFMAQYLPVSSRAFAARNTTEFRELYIVVSKLVFVAASPAVIALAAFPETILHTLYGPGYPASGLIVWLLLPGFVVNLVFGLNSSALSAVGDRRALARTGVAATTAMVVLAFALVPPFRAEGAAAATSGTYVILNLVVAYALLRAAGVRPFRRDLTITVLSWSAPLAAALAIRASLDEVDFGEALAISITLSLVWVLVLFALRSLRPSEIAKLLPRGR